MIGYVKYIGKEKIYLNDNFSLYPNNIYKMYHNYDTPFVNKPIKDIFYIKDENSFQRYYFDKNDSGFILVNKLKIKFEKVLKR